MGLYAVIKPSRLLSDAGVLSAQALAAEALSEGEETGVFSVVAGLNEGDGAVVELATRDETHARSQLERIVFIKSGLVNAELLAFADADGTADRPGPADHEDRANNGKPIQADAWLDLPQPYRNAAL